MFKLQLMAGFIFIIISAVLMSASATNAQEKEPFSMKKFYAFLLDGDIPEALKFIRVNDTVLSETERKTKDELELRFGKESDESDYLNNKRSGIDDLMKIYRDYWRRSFLTSNPEDSSLKKELTVFFQSRDGVSDGSDNYYEDDTLDMLVKNYIQQNGFRTTGFGKTGKFYDLLVWRSETDTAYSFELNGNTISPRVVFMTEFVTLGWEEYATLGKHYPGGWATREALFCVRDAYDLESENFLISYLAHEGQHFEDYKLYPELSGTDLEYRAKLVELSLANESLYNVIAFFINNADKSSSNPHAIANYCVIRDISRIIFDKDFESDTDRWRTIPAPFINEECRLLLLKNSEDLAKEGSGVMNFISP